MTTIRRASPGDLPAVLNVLNGANLETDVAEIRAAIAGGDVFVAADEGPILGALVLSGEEITAIAVRPGRRGQGIGSALVRAAAPHRPQLEATFPAPLRPFYASLDFVIDPTDEPGRLRGVRPDN